MIAYHFPPVQGSSGLQRTLSFANHLAAADWQVTVLTVTTNAYERVNPDQLKDVHPGIRVVRVPCLDTQRHLALKGRYFRAMAIPDRWISWYLPALLAGWWITRETHDYIWCTYPIATAQKIGARLAKLRNIPLIADFRDQMTEPGYPSDPQQFSSFERIERDVVAQAHKLVFTAPGALRMYQERYPELAQDSFVVIENGYEERYFENLKPSRDPTLHHTLLHSGIVYPEERDPRALFDALRNLKRSGELGAIRLHLRASGNDKMFEDMIAARDIGDVVSLLPSISYQDAISEMTGGKSLLVMQGPTCNHQIPAKVYEYLRAGSNIVALAPAQSDTWGVLSRAGVNRLADIDSVEDIEQLLKQFAQDTVHEAYDVETIQKLSRGQRAAELMVLLDQ